MLAGRQGPFKARNRRRLSSHSLGELRLSKAGLLTRLQQRVEQRRFLALNALDFGPNAGAAHQLLDELVMRSHV
jgi:hypothetical protein